MTIDLNKEAEEYCKKQYPDYLDKKEALLVQEDFIAGANSKYVQQQLIQSQIDVLTPYLEFNDEFSHYISLDIQKLEKELKQLQDDNNNHT